MAIFHSYVSLPEGKYEWKNNDQPVDGMFFFFPAVQDFQINSDLEKDRPNAEISPTKM